MSTEFNNSQFASLYPKGSDNYYWSRARMDIIYHFIQSNNLKHQKMLEIGSGSGIVLRHLLKKGIDCFGTELAKVPIQEDLKNAMWSGKGYEALPNEFKSKIEAILLFDVIEHIEDEKEFINKIVQEFPNLKTIVITVPAFMSLFSNFDTFNGHYRRHDLKSLNASVVSNNISLQSWSYYFHGLYLPARLFSLFNVKRKTKVNPPVSKIATFFHKIIARVFFLEYFLIPKKIPGTSLIAFYTIGQDKND